MLLSCQDSHTNKEVSYYTMNLFIQILMQEVGRV